MNDADYYDARDDRLLSYPEARRLDQGRRIAIGASPGYLATYAGQVALLATANLLGRMARQITLAIPPTVIVAPLPWAGASLPAYALAQMQAADPRGNYCCAPVGDGDFLIHLGPSGSPIVTHGVGWLAYHGPAPSPLPADLSANPIGAALAVVAMAARLAANGLDVPPPVVTLNSYDWTDRISNAAPALPAAPAVGSIWTIGTGSVGTAALYFLSLATRNFEAMLFDGDKVKRENITRSPIFSDRDIGEAKADVTECYLRSLGMREVVAEAVPLHESRRWSQRATGTPDLVIAAANEHNVRHLIESLFPPIQIYGTTGKNWQASVIRHMPLIDSCSCCLFPEGTYAPTTCATDEEITAAAATDAPHIDASLPFLSFAAGLMAAAEILKLQLPGYAMTPNRATLYTRHDVRLVKAGVPGRPNCLCATRSREAHVRMIAGSRYAGLGTPR